MKKLIYVSLIVLLCSQGIWAQVPDNFKYQAVIRNDVGELITEQSVYIRISLKDKVSDGAILYTEVHTESTNAYGVINIIIGNGTVEIGDFKQINWGEDSKFLNVEVDAGSGYTDMGTVQLLSVPYAMFANVADSANIAVAANTANIAIIADSARVAASAYYTDMANFADSSRISASAYNTNSANFADSARVAGIAHTAYTADALGSEGVYSTNSDTLFVVKDHSGNVVFAVFPDGAQLIVNEMVKGKVGGFAVSGRTSTKGIVNDYFYVTSDSTRVYVNDTSVVKGKVGGFAVSGRTSTKGVYNDYLQVTRDSTKIYINEDGAKGKVGGFAVSGRTSVKGIYNDYIQVTKDSTRVYVSESVAKGKVGGFAVSGRTSVKGKSEHMFITTTDSTRIFTKDTMGGFGVRDNSSGVSSSYMQLTPLNYFIGHKSGQKIEFDPLNPGMGKYNTFFGYKTGENTVSGYKNIFMGYKAGQGNISGAWNIFIGNSAGLNSEDALSNIFIGDQAGLNFANGIQNVFIGNNAGYSTNQNVYNNLFVGNSAGRNNLSGNYNTYIGISAGYNALGDNNAYIGNTSGFSNTGFENTFIGSNSGIYSLTGSKNVYIGYKAGYRSYGTRNVFIGTNANNTKFSSVDYSNCIAIGDSVIVTGDNQIRIGNSNATSYYALGIYSSTTANAANLYIYSSGRIVRSTSSKRYKKDITSLEINTSDIYKLNPVSFTEINDNKRHFGLIAEEVAEVIPELAEFAREKDVIPGSNSEELIPDAVQYSILSVLLLKEVHKHESTINRQNKDIETLKKENKELEVRLKKLEEMMLK